MLICSGSFEIYNFRICGKHKSMYRLLFSLLSYYLLLITYNISPFSAFRFGHITEQKSNCSVHVCFYSTDWSHSCTYIVVFRQYVRPE